MLTIGSSMIVLLAATPIAAAPAGDGSGCAVIDSIGQCLVAAVDPGRPGGPRDPDPKQRPKAAVPSGGQKSVAKAQVPAGPAPDWWVEQQFEAARIRAELEGPARGTAPVPRAAPDTQQTLAILTQQSIEQLTLRSPALHTSAGPRGIVGVPIWLWIDAAAADPVSATAVAGAAEVTATARLTAVTWEMGPPGATVRCSGPGTPWTGGTGASPDCGYVYALRSLPERTAGRGTWTITATCTWTVTFTGASGGVPVADEQTVSVSTSTELAVDEVQVLVGGDGS